jgi:lipoyl-dependent peroxiredoxin
MILKARAVWRGSGRAGNGDLSTDSGVLANTPGGFAMWNSGGHRPAAIAIALTAGRGTHQDEGELTVREVPKVSSRN